MSQSIMCHPERGWVGGREVSYVHPERNGQPVVPMTFSLELMAEAGTLIVSDWVVTAIRNVQLVRWLVFDEDFPHTIELVGRLLKRDDRTVQLEMRIFDQGFEPEPDREGNLAAVATVEMEPSYPVPPPVGDFALTGDRPCRIPLDVLYKNLFHGELFQGVMSLDRYGNEGIQAQIRLDTLFDQIFCHAKMIRLFFNKGSGNFQFPSLPKSVSTL